MSHLLCKFARKLISIMKKNYSKLLLMAITLAATACSQPQDTTRIDEARNRATAAADSVVAADSTRLMALQKSILAAKAVQSEYLLTGDTAAADTFDTTFRRQIAMRNERLAEEMFNPTAAIQARRKK